MGTRALLGGMSVFLMLLATVVAVSGVFIIISTISVTEIIG